MAGAIVIHREKSLNSWARKMKIVLNGTTAGDVGNGGTTRIPVEAGLHRVLVKMDFYKSSELELDVEEEGEVELYCGFPKGAKGFLKSAITVNYLILQTAEDYAAASAAPPVESSPPQLPPVPAASVPAVPPATAEKDKPKAVKAASKGSIFVSYRRADSEHVTGRVYDRLTGRFGKDSIFKDVDSIPLGVDFRDYLRSSLASCEAVLVVIGEQWEHLKNEDGELRLNAEVDHVRIEIELALERGIPVIPLLVRRTKTPAPADLPESIRELSYRNGIPIRPDPDFRHDMDRLIESLESVVKS